MIDSLEATADAQSLKVIWSGGTQSELSAADLRREAMDAGSRRERFDRGDVTVLPGIRITGLYAVGSYGVNVHFSDGHDRAIYPFSYLRELSDRFDK